MRNAPLITEGAAVSVDESCIDALFSHLDQGHLPGAAVGIAVGGVPVYRKAFGLANMELPLALSPSIRMRVASVTKHFVALAYLLLCEDGVASLDDAIGVHVPGLGSGVSAARVRDLMGHTSGIRCVYDISWLFDGTGHPIEAERLLAFYGEIVDVSAAPGSSWRYGNGGYLLLAAAIERLSGMSLATFLHNRIFAPVGMHDTTLRDFENDFIPNSATLHTTRKGGGFERAYMGLALSGAGSMVSTIDDMLRWLAHMDAPIVGNAATWHALKEPLTLENGTSTGYALGLIVGTYRGTKILSHSGMVMGGTAQMLKVPATGIDIIVISNRHDTSSVELAYQILDACLPGLDPILAPASLPLVTGCFQSARSGRTVQLFGRDGLQFASIDGYDWPFTQDEDGRLRLVKRLDFIKLALSIEGDRANPVAVVLEDFGTAERLLPLAVPGDRRSQKIAGSYRWSASVEATVVVDGDHVYLQTRGPFGSIQYCLEAVGELSWKIVSPCAMQLGGLLVFTGDYSEFVLSTPRNRSMKFERSPCGT